MGAPHSPLGKLRRPSHQPLGPVGGGTRAAAGDSVSEACLDLLLSALNGQGRAGLGWAPGLQREGPFVRGLQGSLEQKSCPLCCSVASAAPEFARGSFLQIFYGLWVRS